MSELIILPPFGSSTTNIYTDGAGKLVTEVFNRSGSTIQKMSVVYIDGSHGNLPTIAKSIANSEMGSTKTLGIVESNIDDQKSGIVVVAGRLENLNTNLPTWNEGQGLWLSPTVSGGITNVKPSAPDHMVFVGTLIRKHPTHGVIEVKIQNGFEIEELHNVQISSLISNEIISYDSATQLWKNKPLAKTYFYVNAANGGSTLIGSNYNHLFLDPSSLISTYSVTMPSNPKDGTEILISAGEFGITNLTLLPNTGQNFINGSSVSSLSGNGFVEFKWISGIGKWARIR